jgi:hypothetical protein
VNESPPFRAERRERAQRAFEEFRARCFWSWPPETIVTEELIPQIIRGLRRHGGHAGYRKAAELCP